MPAYASITYSTRAERRMQKRRLARHDVELALRVGEGYDEEDGTWVYEWEHIRVVIGERGGNAQFVTAIRLRRHS